MIEDATVQELHLRIGDALAAREKDAEADGREPLDSASRRHLATDLIARELARTTELRLQAGRPPLSPDDEAELERTVLNRLFGLGRLQDYIDDPSVSDITLYGCDVVWLRFRDGSKVKGEPVASTDAELIQLIQAQARRGALSEKTWDFSSPSLDLQLPSGDRLHALAWVSQRPSVSIRRHNFDLYRLKQLTPHTISGSLHAFLSSAVTARLNILVAGATSAGKTTLLRCLLNELDPTERVVTVEDSLELGLSRFPDLHTDLVETEARDDNTEGVGAVPMHDLVRESLRMGPDRVIVGEIRGDEVRPMLLAMSQGNDGSMSTIHADSSGTVFSRLQMYMAMTPERFGPETTSLMVANALDLVVHLAVTDTGQRAVTSVREVVDADGDRVVTNELYAPGPDGRALPAYPPTDFTLQRLERAGFDRSWLSPHRGDWDL